MTNEELTEEIKNANLKETTKFNLQQIANFVDFVSPDKKTNEYYTSLVFLVMHDCEKGVNKKNTEPKEIIKYPLSVITEEDY